MRQELVALRPAGGFSCILADPPWRVAMWSTKGMDRSPDGPAPGHITAGGYYRSAKTPNTPERHYATMPLDDIKALEVPHVAARDCVLFLWAVDPLLPEAIEVGRAWGFTYKTTAFYWAKMRREGSTRHRLHEELAHKMFPMGTGYWTRANPEVCLLFTRGAPKRLSASVRKLVVAPRREHSRKPDEVHQAIEQLVAGPRLELFAREAREGWTAWGNQTDRFAPLAAE